MDHRPRKEDPFFSTNRWCHPLPALLGGRVGHGMAPPLDPSSSKPNKASDPLVGPPYCAATGWPGGSALCAPGLPSSISTEGSESPSLAWRATAKGDDSRDRGAPSRHTHAHTPSQARLAMERVLSARAFRGCTAQGKQSFAAQRHQLANHPAWRAMLMRHWGPRWRKADGYHWAKLQKASWKRGAWSM